MLDQQYGRDEPFVAPALYELASAYETLQLTDRTLELLARAERAARLHDDDNLLAAALCSQARLQLRDTPDEARRQVVTAHAALARLATPSLDSVTSCGRADALIFELDGDRAAAIATLQAMVTSLKADPTAAAQDRLRVMNELSRMYYNQRDLPRTLEITDEILAQMERSGLSASAGYLINALNRTAILQGMGEIAAAFEQQSALLQRVESLDAAARPVGLTSPYAGSLVRLARYDEALALYERQLAAAQAAANAYLVAESELQLGRVKVSMGRFAEAQDHLDRAEAQFLKTPQSNARLLDALTVFRARALVGLGEADRARELVESSLRALNYPQVRSAPGLMNVLRVAAEVCLEAGDPTSAERYASDFLEQARALARGPDTSADVGQALVLRGKARRALGQETAAVADLKVAVASLENGFGATHPETLEALALSR